MQSPPSAAQLTELAGKYYSEDLDAEYRVQVEDGKQFAYGLRNGRVLLDPKAEDRFSMPGDGAIEFRRDAARKVEGATYSSTRVLSLPFVRMAQ